MMTGADSSMAWRRGMPRLTLFRPQRLLELLNRHGFAEQVALVAYAVALFERIQLRLGFHPLCDHTQVEVVHETDDILHQQRGVAAIGDRLHEALVDLELVDGDRKS